MEVRDPPVSGECPAPSQNQPATVLGFLKPAARSKISAAIRGTFTPAVHGQRKPFVAHASLPAVSMASPPAVHVASPSAVGLASPPAVHVASLPQGRGSLQARARSSTAPCRDSPSKALCCACASGGTSVSFSRHFSVYNFLIFLCIFNSG